jgi:hypothetical protein
MVNKVESARVSSRALYTLRSKGLAILFSRGSRGTEVTGGVVFGGRATSGYSILMHSLNAAIRESNFTCRCPGDEEG